MRIQNYAWWLAIYLFAIPLCGFGEVVDGIAAIVNTNIITFSDVRDYMQPVEHELRSIYKGQELQEKLKKAALEALNTLVERTLIIEEFRSKRFQLPDSIVEERLREIIKQDYGGQKQLLIRTMAARGMTMADYREKLRNQIIIQAMRQHQVTGEIIISPAKIESYYQAHKNQYQVGDQIKLRMLVIKKALNPDDNVARKQLIDEISAKLQAGADFKELTKQYSEDSNKEEERGSWGWIGRDVLRKELSDAAFALKPGRHSSVVETEDGYYLLKVEEFQAAHLHPLREVRDEIEKKLANEEKACLQQEWVDRLKAKAYIRYF